MIFPGDFPIEKAPDCGYNGYKQRFGYTIQSEKGPFL